MRQYRPFSNGRPGLQLGAGCDIGQAARKSASFDGLLRTPTMSGCCGRLASHDASQCLLIAPYKAFVGELPAVGIYFTEAVGVELTDKAAEVVVLEISG